MSNAELERAATARLRRLAEGLPAGAPGNGACGALLTPDSPPLEPTPLEPTPPDLGWRTVGWIPVSRVIFDA